MLHHQGTELNTNPLPSTGLQLTDCVCHCVRQWCIMVMAHSSGTNNQQKGLVQNLVWPDFDGIEMLTHFNTYTDV